jgi:glycosyltransferase involved in cell wall biosynthesis
MRILHIIHSLDPLKGGPPEGVRRLAAAYQREGHEIEVATLDDPAAPFLTEAPFPIHAHGPGWLKYGYSSRLVRWLRANVARFDAVIVNGLWQYHGRATWLAVHGRQPYAVFPHGMLDPYFNRPFLTKFVKKWLYWIFSERRLIADAHRVYFTSEAEQRLAATSLWPYRANGMVVPYGVPGPPSGDAEGLRQSFYRAWPPLEGKRFLLFLGRVHPKKGCDLLIEAFAAAAGDALDLVIAGPVEKAWKSRLQQRAAELGVAWRVHWPGMLAGDAKWGAFFASEAFILPSHQENFGIAVAEALACGVPVLISDKVNIFDQVEGDGAALVEPDTLAGTTALIRRWLALSDAAKEEMRRAARRSFEARFDAERLSHATLACFVEAGDREQGTGIRH